MSEIVTPPPDPPTESASDAAPDVRAAPSIASAPVLAIPHASAPDTHALVELIARGLAADADEATRDAARALWARCAHAIATAVPITPAAPVLPSMPILPTMPGMPGAPSMPLAPLMPAVPLPTSPLAMVARTLGQLSPDQLLELALQRLRAALPAGATVPTPKGVQFQLVPVVPPADGLGSR